MITAGVKSTMTRRYGAANPRFSAADVKTVRDIIKKLFLAGMADMSTEARDIACSCPRMSYSWYLVCHALSAFLVSCCKWNADASTHVFLPKGKGEKVCCLAPDSEYAKLLDDIEDGNAVALEEIGAENANWK